MNGPGGICGWFSAGPAGTPPACTAGAPVLPFVLRRDFVDQLLARGRRGGCDLENGTGAAQPPASASYTAR